MAKVLFIGLDGTEKSYRLHTHRPFTIGRDPGNDIILRDPKVSRHHAEVVFERGFFVLHDLASANGTFINGRRIRVAPLTHGSQMRLGNTTGRFSEELPTESDRAAKLDGPVPPHPNVDDDITPLPTAPQPRRVTPGLPSDTIGPDDSKKK